MLSLYVVAVVGYDVNMLLLALAFRLHQCELCAPSGNKRDKAGEGNARRVYIHQRSKAAHRSVPANQCQPVPIRANQCQPASQCQSTSASQRQPTCANQPVPTTANQCQPSANQGQPVPANQCLPVISNTQCFDLEACSTKACWEFVKL